MTITHHADVRRMLMLQKSYAEGLRALYLYTAAQQDAVRAGGPDARLAAAVNDLLLPIVKGVGSERASEMLVLSLQTLGGSGYLQDYPIEQYVRDAKIDSLYEGTTAIQSLDLLFRKIIRDRGRALGHVVEQIASFLDEEGGNGRLKEERALLATALADVRGMLSTLTGHVAAAGREPARVHRAGQHSVRLLMALGDLLVGWLLLRRAQVALEVLDAGTPRDRAFYEGKVAVARFFATTRLPLLTAERAIVDAADDSLMELAEAAFWSRLAGDVRRELLALALELVDAGLHQVADADDADQAALVADGQVPDPAVGHDPRQVRRPVARRAGDDVGAHDVADGALEQVAAALVQLPDDVALGHDAHQLLVVHHRKGADVVLREQAEQLADRGRRRDGGQGGARGLPPQDVRNQHLDPRNPPLVVVEG